MPQTLQHERYIPSFHGKFDISFHGKFTKPVLYKEHRSFPNIYTNTWRRDHDPWTHYNKTRN